MYAEVVGVDWPEKRIVSIRVELPAELERLETSLRVRGRQLEAVGRHMAIGASASVTAEATDLAIEKRMQTAFHRSTLGTRTLTVEAGGDYRRLSHQRCSHPKLDNRYRFVHSSLILNVLFISLSCSRIGLGSKRCRRLGGLQFHSQEQMLQCNGYDLQVTNSSRTKVMKSGDLLAYRRGKLATNSNRAWGHDGEDPPSSLTRR